MGPHVGVQAHHNRPLVRCPCLNVTKISDPELKSTCTDSVLCETPLFCGVVMTNGPLRWTVVALEFVFWTFFLFQLALFKLKRQ